MAKAPTDIRSLARNHTSEAIDRLVHWMRSDREKASVSAAIALLDRGWGKAPQVLTDEDGGPLQIIVRQFQLADDRTPK